MRPLRITCLLLGLTAISGCEDGLSPIDHIVAGFHDTTIEPIERAFEDRQPVDPLAAYARALPVARGEPPTPETPAIVADLRRAAELDHPPSQNLLGMLYDRGRGGVPKNPSQAAVWFTRAAVQGYGLAAFNLGALYLTGTGVPQDFDYAFGWFKGAAEQGHAEAQYQLALMLEDGIGRSRDMEVAVRWYYVSAQAGYAPAQHNLAVAFAAGAGVARDDAAAAHWYRRAADQGQPKSQLLLAEALAAGKGVPRDRSEAWTRFMLAASGAGQDQQLRSTAEARATALAATLSPAELEKAKRELASRQPARG